MAAMQEGEDGPMCELIDVEAKEEDGVCPQGCYYDGGKFCYHGCAASFNTNDRTLFDEAVRVRYVNSTKNDEHCMPLCPEGSYKVDSSYEFGVQCVVCPAGFVGVVGLGCLRKCAAPFTVESGVGAVEPPHRLAARHGSAPQDRHLSNMAKKKAEWTCKPGAVNLVIPYDWEDPKDRGQDPYTGECFRCPSGYKATRTRNWAICTQRSCPAAYPARCGGYCYKPAVLDFLSRLNGKECSSLLGLFHGSLPDCAPPPGTRRAALKPVRASGPKPGGTPGAAGGAAAGGASVAGIAGPVCVRQSEVEAKEVDPVCPAGYTPDDNNPVCYAPCSDFNRQPNQQCLVCDAELSVPALKMGCRNNDTGAVTAPLASRYFYSRQREMEDQECPAGSRAYYWENKDDPEEPGDSGFFKCADATLDPYPNDWAAPTAPQRPAPPGGASAAPTASTPRFPASPS
ncbi:hypothetical protein C2E20_2508 isoform B [Micractinium conductrix]|uniref:Uncharacterized protein n=1 Tax=Micractinium conductrix TaxID=554055 RepID=A0A2P6VIT7_9CHLO|nr:hypothetical protein C2E20_2508 isoform B [Micractinium conductrix]|eukprot:PSC73992.1 hypothetical protein C2E20_2508 isoform B [Micractinium conductrix]